ncbi:cation diffusion facilitator family transporter [Nostocoides sp. F2B08]|uniref:cation diffusion facilitator family transporter n=1 Tax=Nostocoides sp. F2B08 TaxID=2653936 RepID=UPI001D0366A7|nr:cation diffusion facilitator family transporter [Tetrasphaera sp. F2B08]
MGGTQSASSAPPTKGPTNLTKFAWLAIATALATIALKMAAYLVTGSVGLLSDAAESVVNLVAAFVALIVLHIAAKPADENHHFGHTKAEYFSAAVEGIMIFVAAVVIIVAAVERFINPQPLEQVGLGLAISVVASVLNGAVALVLVRAGRRHRSITLEADGRHLFTDVVTSAGVIVAVLLVALTGWLRLDPIIAFLVGCNIIWTGWTLVRRSVDGLMDHTMTPEEHDRLTATLSRFSSEDVVFHGVRTRESGAEKHVAMHVLVPGTWSVQRGHDLLEEVEEAVRTEFGRCEVVTHLEPLEDPRSYEDGPGLAVPSDHRPDRHHGPR